MSDYSTTNSKLLFELGGSLTEVTEQNLEEVVTLWDTIYGTSSDNVVKQISNELKKHFEDFWKQETAKLNESRDDYLKKISATGSEAVALEKVLDLEPQVSKVPNHGPLVQIYEQLMQLLESYQEMKGKRLAEYFKLQIKEEELCSDLMLPKPKYELPYDGALLAASHYVPTADEITEIKERINQLEQQKEQLEYDFEEGKCQLRQLLEECEVPPLTKEERFACDEAELAATESNLKLIMTAVDYYKKKKEELVAEADDLRDQIERLSKKMFKNLDELKEFLSAYSGFTEPTIYKLNEKLKQLKEERKHNLKELIANSRKELIELWDKCCYSEDQRKEFGPFNATRRTEEVLDFHELEIESLENFYNRNKKIFSLAKQYEVLWERLLHLEDQANNKDRLFNNRGGCLLKEEKERKHIQKKVPAIKAELMDLLHAYKEETGKDFLHFGEPLQQKIEDKEHMREISKHQERLQRKNTNAENVMLESRLGARPVVGSKRKAGMTPLDPNRIKSMRTEITTASSSSSTASSACSTKVMKQKEQVKGPSHLVVPTNYCMATPSRSKIPAASTPQNGSLSYESFQEHIEKSKYLAHNSTRNTEQQRVLRPKNLNQTRTVIDKTTPYKTPKTPSKTFTKTPTKTPSRIPFRIATGSKIPSQVPPISPRRKPVLSTTKLPIIF